MKFLLSVVFFIVVTSYANIALAAEPFVVPPYSNTNGGGVLISNGNTTTNTPFLNKINNDFAAFVPLWGNLMIGYATSLFWKLVLIDFTWTTIVWVKDRKEFGEILTGYVGKILTVGFFWSLIMFAGVWIPAIIGSFAQIGQSVGNGGVITPDSIFRGSFKIVSAMYGNLSVLDITDRVAVSFGVAISSLCIIIGFAMIAAQLMVTLIESYIAIGAGVLLLGFGGSRWTSDMASSYLKFAVGTGMKLMLCYLVIGAGQTLFSFPVFIVDPASDTVIKDFIISSMILACEALIFVYLAFNVPGLAAAMMSGSPNMSMGGLAGAAITAGSAVAGAVGGAASAGGALQNKAAALGGADSKLQSMLSPKSGGGGPGVAANAMNGGGGSGGVQPPGSGLGTTPSNMPGMPKSGPIATSLANDAAAKESANTPQFGDSSGSSFVGPQAPTSVAPSSSIISTDTNIGNAKAAASSAPAAPVPAAKAGGGAAPAGSSSSVVPPAAADSPSSVSPPSGDSPASTSGGEQGDASGASVGAADPHTALLTAISENMAKMANGPEQVQSAAEKITALNKYVPNDGASVSTPGISMGHTKD